MSKGKELAKNTAIIFVGTFCTKLISFLLLPLYTGILSSEEYGIYNLLTTIVSLLIPIITFQIEQAVFRELINSRYNNDNKKRIISSAILVLCIQSIIYILLFSILYSFIKIEYKMFMVFNAITTIYSSLLLQISRGLGDNKKYSIGSFISAITTISFNILFLLFVKLHVDGMLYSLIIGQVITCIYLFISLKIYKYINIKYFDNKTVYSLWKYSLPLVPNALSWWVFVSSDRIIVSTILGLSMVGVLSAASKFSEAFIVLYNIIDRSWIESISLHIEDADIEQFFNKAFNAILAFFASIIIIAISSMPVVFRIMINESYSEGYNLVPILLVSSLFNVVQGLIIVICAAKKDTKSIAKTSFAAALMNIIFHLSMIKYIGIYAAALSTLLAYFIIAIYRYYDIKKKYLNIKISKRNILAILPSLIIVLLLYYFGNYYFKIVSFILSIMVFLILNKNTIGIIKSFILNRRKVVINE